MRWYQYIAYFFGGAFLEFRSAFHQRRVGPFVSDSIRLAARPRTLSGLGQRALGAF